MNQALSRYHALYESLQSRRAKPVLHKGLDRVAGRLLMRLKTGRITLGFLEREAAKIDALEPEARGLSDGALDERMAEVREAFVRGRQDDEAVRRALALTREVARRETGENPFHVQIMGALALYHGRIVEMLTGEGKTLTGSVAAPLIAWQRRSLHVFTVNDYLARRDAESRRPIYRRCLCEVGAIQQEQEPRERFSIYARQIVYGTPKQIVADWLRDQIRLGKMNTAWTSRYVLSQSARWLSDASTGPMIPGLKAALVDEADAVLIDEGGVPLIIARPREEHAMSAVYLAADAIAAKLDEGPDYTIDYLKRKAELKRRGRNRLTNFFEERPEAIWRAQRRAEELVRMALVARHCYIRGRQYELVEGRIVIVDEYTGRFLADRNWEHGLHQAVEAKERAEVTADRETLARLSFQRFYRSYPFLSGMTGTAADARIEMEATYSRPVTPLPTNRPVIREQWPLRAFRTTEGKWRAIVASIERVHAEGRPILVGTRSIAASENLSARLAERGIRHSVLNAHHDKEEAAIIADAGRAGAVTVATNMAGRGTDIKPDPEAVRAGGLHVILTEMHGAKRIDRQFIGRSGRQGDPGSAQIFVSLEDELIERHAKVLCRILRARAGLRFAQGRALEAAVIGGDGYDELDAAWSRMTERFFRIAQSRSEARDRRSREAVLKQDDWVDKYMPGI